MSRAIKRKTRPANQASWIIKPSTPWQDTCKVHYRARSNPGMQSISRSKTDPRGNVCNLSVRVAHVLHLLSPYAVRYSTLNSTLPWDSLPPAKLLCDSVITSIGGFSIDETSFDKHNRFSLNTSPVHGKNSVSVYLASHRAKNCNIICTVYDDLTVHCFEKIHAPSTYSNLYAHCTIPGGSAGKQLGDERLPSIIGWSCFFFFDLDNHS